MSIESLENSTESDPREKIDKFINGFNDIILKNSNGKDVALKVSHGNSPKFSKDDPMAEFAYVEFEGYKGHEDDRGGNYIGFVIIPEEKKVYLSYARLNDKDLRGENIYNQIMGIMGKNFPEGFALSATIEHEKTKEKALDLPEGFDEGEINREDLEAGVRKSGMFKLITDIGFNESKIKLTADGEIDVISKKNPNIQNPVIETEIEAVDSDGAE